MSAKLKKIALLYSFLPALLLPHLPRLHPPLTCLPVAVLLRSLLSSSSSFFLCRLSCSFILNPPPQSGLSERLLAGWGQSGSNSTSGPGQTTSVCSAANQKGVQAADGGHRSATEQAKAALPPRGRSGRSAGSDPTTLWFSLWVLVRFLFHTCLGWDPTPKPTNSAPEPGSPGEGYKRWKSQSDNVGSLRSPVNKSIHTHTHTPV